MLVMYTYCLIGYSIGRSGKNDVGQVSCSKQSESRPVAVGREPAVNSPAICCPVCLDTHVQVLGQVNFC